MGLLLLLVVFLLFFNLYPFWMQQAIWQAFCYYCLAYLGIGSLRLVVYALSYHFGMKLWLFPNYRKSYNPVKFMLPVTSHEWREGAFEVQSLVYKVISISLIAYLGYQFTRDE